MIRKILDAMIGDSSNGNGAREVEALEAENKVFNQAREVKSKEAEFELRVSRIRKKMNTAILRRGGGNEEGGVGNNGKS